jgi:hydrogenase maturation protease
VPNPSELLPWNTLVVGLGNDFRNDDGAGLAALRLFGNRGIQGIKTVELRDDLTKLIDHLQGVTTAYIIDAVRSDSPPGTIHRFEATENCSSPTDLPRSTHGLSLRNLLELARLQGEMPKKVVIYGIEGEQFGYGNTLTPAVHDAVSAVVDTICIELERDRR